MGLWGLGYALLNRDTGIKQGKINQQQYQDKLAADAADLAMRQQVASQQAEEARARMAYNQELLKTQHSARILDEPSRVLLGLPPLEGGYDNNSPIVVDAIARFKQTQWAKQYGASPAPDAGLQQPITSEAMPAPAGAGVQELPPLFDTLPTPQPTTEATATPPPPQFSAPALNFGGKGFVNPAEMAKPQLETTPPTPTSTIANQTPPPPVSTSATTPTPIEADPEVLAAKAEADQYDIPGLQKSLKEYETNAATALKLGDQESYKIFSGQAAQVRDDLRLALGAKSKVTLATAAAKAKAAAAETDSTPQERLVPVVQKDGSIAYEYVTDENGNRVKLDAKSYAVLGAGQRLLASAVYKQTGPKAKADIANDAATLKLKQDAALVQKGHLERSDRIDQQRADSYDRHNRITEGISQQNANRPRSGGGGGRGSAGGTGKIDSQQRIVLTQQANRAWDKQKAAEKAYLDSTWYVDANNKGHDLRTTTWDGADMAMKKAFDAMYAADNTRLFALRAAEAADNKIAALLPSGGEVKPFSPSSAGKQAQQQSSDWQREADIIMKEPSFSKMSWEDTIKPILVQKGYDEAKMRKIRALLKK